MKTISLLVLSALAFASVKTVKLSHNLQQQNALAQQESAVARTEVNADDEGCPYANNNNNNNSNSGNCSGGACDTLNRKKEAKKIKKLIKAAGNWNKQCKKEYRKLKKNKTLNDDEWLIALDEFADKWGVGDNDDSGSQGDGDSGSSGDSSSGDSSSGDSGSLGDSSSGDSSSGDSGSNGDTVDSSFSVENGKIACDLTNDYRATQNLDPVEWDQGLHDICVPHSDGMADGTIPFGHDGFQDRFNEYNAKVGSARSVAENVAMNWSGSEGAVNQWIKSDGHRKNMEGNYNRCAVAVTKTEAGAWYFTQMFVRV